MKRLPLVLLTMLALVGAGFTIDATKAVAAPMVVEDGGGGSAYQPCNANYDGVVRYMVANRFMQPWGSGYFHYWKCQIDYVIYAAWDYYHGSYFEDGGWTLAWQGGWRTYDDPHDCRNCNPVYVWKWLNY